MSNTVVILFFGLARSGSINAIPNKYTGGILSVKPYYPRIGSQEVLVYFVT